MQAIELKTRRLVLPAFPDYGICILENWRLELMTNALVGSLK